MNNEVAPSYSDVIDQFTLGHEFLKRILGEDGVPTMVWQIDPLGHSVTHAVLYSMVSEYWGLTSLLECRLISVYEINQADPCHE